MKGAAIIFGILLIPCLSHCRVRLAVSESAENDLANWGLTGRRSELQAPTVVSENRDDPDLITFFLHPGPWTTKNKVVIEYNVPESLRDAPLYRGNGKTKFVFLIHGYIQNGQSVFPKNVAKAYIERMGMHKDEHYNVIVVDWGALSGNARDEVPSYVRAVNNIPITAQRVADFIKFMMANGEIKTLDDIHLIGLSLGGQMVGNIGDLLKKENLPGGQVARITGLDPALPLFDKITNFPSRTLTKEDAKFVDVIHTGGGVFGKATPMGNLDFYPNGGAWWNGWTDECNDWSKFSWNHGGPAFCSHNLAPKLYALSILQDNIKSCKCSYYWTYKSGLCGCAVTAIFGEFTDTKHYEEGRYYLNLELPKENELGEE